MQIYRTPKWNGIISTSSSKTLFRFSARDRDDYTYDRLAIGKRFVTAYINTETHTNNHVVMFRVTVVCVFRAVVILIFVFGIRVCMGYVVVDGMRFCVR